MVNQSHAHGMQYTTVEVLLLGMIVLSAITILHDAKLSVLVYGWNACPQVTMKVHMDITLGWDLIQVRLVSLTLILPLCLIYYLAIETTYTSNSAIQFVNVQCVGNESSLLDCSYNTSLQCPYQRAAACSRVFR